MKATIHLWLLLLMMTLFAHNVKTENNTAHYELTTIPSESFSHNDKLLSSFCQPLKFTRSGIRCFFRHVFSRQEYAEEFLPHNFCHLVEFLEFGLDSNQDMAYMQSTFRLFCNKVKHCNYVSPDAYCNLLDKLPKILDSYFVKKPSSLFTEAKNSIKRTLYTMFLSNFAYFKQDPDAFLDEAASTIIQELNKSSFTQTHVNQEQLRQNIIRFLDITLNKVIWSPLDQEEVWTSVKSIGKRLEELHNCSLVNQDELDDLFQSLISRFVHFLDLTGSELPLDLIQNIRDDIHHGKLLMLTLEESEEFIESKVDRLRRALEETEAKILAKNRGIVTDLLPKI
ncbi:MAG: hypothetical protein AB7R69_02270 [Candidatus Babeliales bacterium]